MHKCPGWLRAVFVAVMFFTCAVLCWYASSQYELRFQIADLTLSLDTSRQREVKQQYEYDQVVAELPLVKAEVAEKEPLAAAAQAVEADLRTQRKTLRTQNADLAEQLEAVQAQTQQLILQCDTLLTEVESLREQEKELLETLQSMGINTPGV